MKHPLIINSDGRAERAESFFNKKFPLSALGSIIDKRSLVAAKYFMAKSEWDDIVAYTKDETSTDH
jgi:hypothetical protein